MTYISTQINDLRKKSDWVDGLKYEIEKHNRRRLYSFFVFILSFLAYLNMDIINSYVEIPYIVKTTLEIILLFMFAFSIAYMVGDSNKPKYLAYYLYQIGSEISNFKTETYYLEKNKKYIKKSNKIVRGMQRSIQGHFIDDIFNFYDKLNQIISRLNYLYNSEKSTDVFIANKSDISTNLLMLAEQIYQNDSTLTPNHIQFSNEIYNLLEDVPEKSLAQHKLFVQYAEQKLATQPYLLKSIEFSLFAFVAIFFFLSNFSTITDPIMVSVIITIGIFTKIELFIKK